MAESKPLGQGPAGDDHFNRRVADLLQPESMKTERYQYGVEEVNGHQAWALFCASGVGDLERVRALLDRDSALVNAQYWYQFLIHMAVREGRAEMLQFLLERGPILGNRAIRTIRGTSCWPWPWSEDMLKCMHCSSGQCASASATIPVLPRWSQR